ncbi:hypothetical protein D9M72_574110 [compost metagenome]
MRRDERRETEGVRQQDELLALVVRHVSHVGEKPDRLIPLGFRQPDLACKGMQVLHEARHDRQQPRIFASAHCSDHRLGDGVFIDVAHGTLLLVNQPWPSIGE